MNYSDLADLDLVERFRGGEEEAFGELFKRYKAKLVHVALRYTGDPQASEDIAHDVFLDLHQQIDRFRGRSKFYTYLYGIAYNKCKLHLYYRKRNQEVPLFPEEGEERADGAPPALQAGTESPRQIHDKKELSKLLQQALGQLPEMARQIFILIEIQELSYDDAAKTLGITTGTVGWHVHDARKRLRKLLPLELLEIFFFAGSWRYEGAIFSMNLLLENGKLLLGLPSSLLLSYYLDGETTTWQRTRIEALIRTNTGYQKEYSDCQKLKTLFGQIEAPALAPDFDIRFERKLHGLDDVDADLKPAPSWVPILRPLIGALAISIAAVSFLVGLPAITGSSLSVTQTNGSVRLLRPKTSQWTELRQGAKIQDGAKIRTAEGVTDLALSGQLILRMKENSEVKFDSLFRSKQKGWLRLFQSKGKTLIGLGPGFEGSRLTIDTPFGSTHAYGTLFLVEVSPEQQMTRVMTLEGTVEVEDLKRRVIQPVIAPTERTLTPQEIREARPIASERLFEVQELKNLPVPGKQKKSAKVLEENLSLMMSTGPGRVKEYLENPGLFSRRAFPILTDKISHVRQLISEAGRKKDAQAYEKAIEDLNEFTQNYLDPYGYFKPHIQFFVGGIYHFLGREKEALEAFAKVAEFPDKEWQGMAHFARGLIEEENLKDLEKAKKEYLAVIELSPDSPEAEEARQRLGTSKS